MTLPSKSNRGLHANSKTADLLPKSLLAHSITCKFIQPDRSLADAGPRVCHDLPTELRNTGQSIGAFCRPLKTVLFRLDALALIVIATATWLGGWLSVTAGSVSKRLNPS